MKSRFKLSASAALFSLTVVCQFYANFVPAADAVNCFDLFSDNAIRAKSLREKFLESTNPSSVRGDYSIKPAEQAVLARAEKLYQLGVPALTAIRIAEGYPELAKVILKRGPIKWVTVFRGINIPIHQFNANHLRFLPGGNITALGNGIWVSTSFEEAGYYATHGLHAKSYETKIGTLFEMKVPSFLVKGDGGEVTAHHISRRYTPELDLWITRYVELTDSAQIFRGKDWQRYDRKYLQQTSSNSPEALPLKVRLMRTFYRALNLVF